MNNNINYVIAAEPQHGNFEKHDQTVNVAFATDNNTIYIVIYRYSEVPERWQVVYKVSGSIIISGDE